MSLVITNLPDELRLVDGKIVMKDGSDLEAYMKQFASDAKVSAEEPMILMKRSTVQKILCNQFFNFVA